MSKHRHKRREDKEEGKWGKAKRNIRRKKGVKEKEVEQDDEGTIDYERHRVWGKCNLASKAHHPLMQPSQSYYLVVSWGAVSKKINEFISQTLSWEDNMRLRMVLETIRILQKAHLNPIATTVNTCEEVAVSQGTAVRRVVPSICVLADQENFIMCDWPMSSTHI